MSEPISDPDLRALIEALEADAAEGRTGRARVRTYLAGLQGRAGPRR